MIESETAKRRLKRALSDGYRDDKVIKPGSFIYSDFVKNVYAESPLGCTARVNRRVRRMGARLLLNRPIKTSLKQRRGLSISGYSGDEIHYDAEFFPIIPEDGTLIHTTMFLNNGTLMK